MRIISEKKLSYSRDYPEYFDSVVPLKIWISKVEGGKWRNHNEVLTDFPDADNVGNNRIVFNIKHNNYMFIVVFRYKIQICYIRFIGAHKQYDKIRNIKEI